MLPMLSNVLKTEELATQSWHTTVQCASCTRKLGKLPHQTLWLTKQHYIRHRNRHSACAEVDRGALSREHQRAGRTHRAHPRTTNHKHGSWRWAANPHSRLNSSITRRRHTQIHDPISLYFYLSLPPFLLLHAPYTFSFSLSPYHLSFFSLFSRSLSFTLSLSIKGLLSPL